MEQARKKPDQARSVAMEANQLHGKVAPEEIGHVLMTPREAAPTIETGKRAETLSREELLRLSQNIRVENTTLKRVYETHLVSEQGLRRLVGEYLQGKDIQKPLRAELVEHEIDFERDPVLRDHGRATSPEAVPGSSQTLSSLLQQAGVADNDRKDGGISLATEKLFEHDQRQDHIRHRRFMDVALISIILILLLLVVILVMSRR